VEKPTEIELVAPKKYDTFPAKPPLPPKSHSYSIPPPPMTTTERLGVFSRSLMSLGKPKDDDMESIGLLDETRKADFT
jgi:hypothetical protein